MKKKKIALIGNMNNNLYSLSKYLIDESYDVTLFLFNNELTHFSPLSDGFDKKYKEYTKTLNWGSLNTLFSVSSRTIKNDLLGFDFFIGSGYAPAFFAKAKLKLNMFLPAGPSLFLLNFNEYYSGFSIKGYLKQIFVAPLMKLGFKKIDYLVWDETNDDLEKKILNMPYFFGKRLKIIPPMIYYPEYSKKSILDNQLGSELVNNVEFLKEKHDLLIMHNVRHVWKDSTMINTLHEKGNDRLFYALKELKDKGKNPVVITFEYGPDFSESKKLIKKLDLENNVFWVKKSMRKDIMTYMVFSDLVVGELVNSWYSYGVVVEALTSGTPIVHNRKSESCKNKESVYPMFFAEQIEDLHKVFLNFYKDEKKFKEIGRKGFLWFKNDINNSVNRIIESIES